MGETADLKQTAQTLFHDLSSYYDLVLDNVTLRQDRFWKRFLLEKANLRRGQRVLDLACGTCVLEERLGISGCDVVGLDLSEQMVRGGMKKRLRNISSLLRADAESLPFSDRSFDVVLSCYLPKYCNAQRLVGEIGRVLSPGGTLIAYDFTRPRGAFAPVHAFYVYGVLELLAAIARRTIREVEYTFARLPGIVKKTNWVEDWLGRLGRRQFEQVGAKALTGGVVTVVWARRVGHYDFRLNASP
jgi:demethylmenaquinone methyltransferase/2-methoxy-6-polyprenyl-1,4-benzoquinol methylase